MTENAIVRIDPAAVMPALSLENARARWSSMVDFTKSIMRDGVDFGTIPGTDKPTLLQPGGEKLQLFFGLETETILAEKVEDWTGEDHGGEPFFYYRFETRVYRAGALITVGHGSANSWEARYRYRWIPASDWDGPTDGLKVKDATISEFAFAIEEAKTSGQYGKPAEYWQRFKDAIASGQARKVKRKTKKGDELDAWEIPSIYYRVPNDDVMSLVNTVLKVSKKRSYIDGMKTATGASEFFTQDMEDLGPRYDPPPWDGGFPEASTPKAEKAEAAKEEKPKAAAKASAKARPPIQQPKAKAETAEEAVEAEVSPPEDDAPPWGSEDEAAPESESDPAEDRAVTEADAKKLVPLLKKHGVMSSAFKVRSERVFGRPVKELKLSELRELAAWVEFGAASPKQIDKLRGTHLKIGGKTWEDAQAFAKENFGCRVKHLDTDQMVKLAGWAIEGAES